MSGVLDELRNGLDYGKVAAELEEFITETERVTSKQVPHFFFRHFWRVVIGYVNKRVLCLGVCGLVYPFWLEAISRFLEV